MRIKLYQFLIIILFPLIVLFFLYRLAKGKEDPKRFFERFGFTKIPKPNLPIIWFHAASVGEFLAAEHLIKLIINKYPAHQILLTTSTWSSAKLVRSKNIKGLIHQVVPFDEYFSVKRFMNHWQPVLSIFIESELWPNLISFAAGYGKLALINARITDKTYKTWLRYNLFFKEVINYFDYIDAQSNKDQLMLGKLGVSNVKNSGNLKYNTKALAINDYEVKKLKEQINNRPVFLIISTHDNEEERLAIVHKRMRIKYPDLLTIIAPRHPGRCPNIVVGLNKMNVKQIICRSEIRNIDASTEIYIIDEIGVLGNYFALTNIVFIGGSLVPIGGHNILEAAKLAKVVIVGKYMQNFYEITQNFLANKALIQVENDEQLYDALEQLFACKELQQSYITNALALIAKNAKTTEVIMQNLTALLDK